MTFDPARIPDKLVEAYQSNRCAVLVGAGASKGAGLPLWRGLLELMLAEGVRHKVIHDGKAAEYKSMLAHDGKFLMAAGSLKADISVYFDEFMTATFIDPKPKPTSLHEALVNLPNLQFCLTTNYDTILERVYRSKVDPDISVCTFKDAGEVQRRLAKREFFVLKAHGDASKLSDGIILTDADYRNILYRERAYQSLLSAMFTMYTVIFVGASMTDPEVSLLLNFIADAFSSGSGPSHFALMSEEETTGVERERWFKDLNVQVIPVSNANNYAEVTEALEALAVRAGTP
jgi:hypothetical protein